MPLAVSTYRAIDCPAGRLYAWHVGGDYAYGSGRMCGIRILDVSDKSSPFEITSYQKEGYSYEHCATGGHLLFAAVHRDGVEIIDISNPGDPTHVGQVKTQNAWAVTVRDSLLFIADGEGGLCVADVSQGISSGRIIGTVAGPDLDVSVRDLDFPYVEIGTCREESVSLTNSGTVPLTIDDISLSDPDFSIDLKGMILDRGEVVEGTLTYCPGNGGTSSILVIESDDPDERVVKVAVRGNSPWGLESGLPAPDFSLPAVNESRHVTLSELQGNVTVIAFFASW